MPVSIQELNDFHQSPTYARWVHTNLHVHTPATRWDWDSRPDQTIRAATLTPETYFDALNKTSLDLVAITDHNCVAWCKPLVKLARQARKAGKSKIHILPGVEITTYEGPHLLALFEETQDVAEIEKMLIRLGMSGEGKKEDRVGCLSPKDEKTISMVLDEVVNHLQGVVIAPHVQRDDGLWGSKEFRGRTDILNDRRLRILAAPSGEIKRVTDRPRKVRLLYKNMDSTKIANSFGFIDVSDCHRLDDFELNTTWIRMTAPGLNGVRQIIYEPELRLGHGVIRSEDEVQYPQSVHFTEPPEVSHPHIIGVSISGGMLNGMKVGFSPHQNSIIGKNYTGKSALLDCLRFAFNTVPLDTDPHDKFADRMRAFVGEGGEVRVYLRDVQGKTYGISRTFSCTRSGRGASAKLLIEGSPEIFLLWNGEFTHESGVSVQSVLPLEVYPQGEVVKIKDNARQQMKIVDSLASVELKLKELTTDQIGGESTLLGRLVQNSKDIILQTEHQVELSSATSGIQGLDEEIKELEKLTTSPLFKEKKEWAEIEVSLDTYKKELERLHGVWSSKSLPSSLDTESKESSASENAPATPEPIAIDEESASPSMFSSSASMVFNEAIAAVGRNLVATRSGLTVAIDRLVKLETTRKAREERLDREIRSSLKPDDQGTEEGGLINRITEKRRRLNNLLEKQRELVIVQQELSRLNKEREDLLEQFRLAWGRIRKSRGEIVQLIDKESASNIRAELIEDAEREDYRKILEQIADRLTNATNRIQAKQAQLDAIANAVTPRELVNIVQGGDANRLTQVAPDVTSNTAKVILGMGQADVHKLEQCLLGDKFVISYKKDGDDVFTPIETALSGGEQALALVSVAMVPKQLPLVIDQPEDELGPALITNELVEQIRHVKLSRQLIFVTHVPNIPVLADSEQVIYLEQEFTTTGKASVVKCAGSLDARDIVFHLLELDGGEIAFLKRSERYSAVMQSDN